MSTVDHDENGWSFDDWIVPFVYSLRDLTTTVLYATLLTTMVHIPSFLVGSVFSGGVFLLVHEKMSHRHRLSAKWPLRGKISCFAVRRCFALCLPFAHLYLLLILSFLRMGRERIPCQVVRIAEQPFLWRRSKESGKNCCVGIELLYWNWMEPPVRIVGFFPDMSNSLTHLVSNLPLFFLQFNAQSLSREWNKALSTVQDSFRKQWLYMHSYVIQPVLQVKTIGVSRQFGTVELWNRMDLSITCILHRPRNVNVLETTRFNININSLPSIYLFLRLFVCVCLLSAFDGRYGPVLCFASLATHSRINSVKNDDSGSKRNSRMFPHCGSAKPLMVGS
jgi:hypothetical protein